MIGGSGRGVATVHEVVPRLRRVGLGVGERGVIAAFVGMARRRGMAMVLGRGGGLKGCAARTG